MNTRLIRKSLLPVLILILVLLCAGACADVALDAGHFPDPVFRQYISTEFDSNRNGILENAEIQQINDISCDELAVESAAGIEYFPALESVYFSHCSLKQLELKRNTNLKELYLNETQLTKLDLSGLPRLETIIAFGNPIESLDVHGCASMTSLEYHGSLTELNVQGCTALTYLGCGCKSPSGILNLSNLPNLKKIECGGENLKMIDVRNSYWLVRLLSDTSNLEMGLDLKSGYYTYFGDDSLIHTKAGVLFVTDSNGSWVLEGNGSPAYRHFVDASGNIKTGWFKTGGFWDYADGSGRIAEGWQKLGGSWYYLDPEHCGRMVQNRRYYINDVAYYFDYNGAMATGWIYTKYGSRYIWHYGEPDGQLAKDWRYINGTWYYFSGYAMATGKQYIGDQIYLFGSDGHMCTGWSTDVDNPSKWYYLAPDGHALVGWQQIGGTWYYFTKNNGMVTGRRKISGKYEYFDENGAWLGSGN